MIPQLSSCWGRRDGTPPPKLRVTSPDRSVTSAHFRVRATGKSAALSIPLCCSSICGEESCYMGYYVTHELHNGSKTRCTSNVWVFQKETMSHFKVSCLNLQQDVQKKPRNTNKCGSEWRVEKYQLVGNIVYKLLLKMHFVKVKGS